MGRFRFVHQFKHILRPGSDKIHRVFATANFKPVYHGRDNEVEVQFAFCQVPGFFQVDDDLIYCVCLCLGNCSRIRGRVFLLGCAVRLNLFFWGLFFFVLFRFVFGLDLFIRFLSLGLVFRRKRCAVAERLTGNFSQRCSNIFDLVHCTPSSPFIIRESKKP